MEQHCLVCGDKIDHLTSNDCIYLCPSCQPKTQSLLHLNSDLREHQNTHSTSTLPQTRHPICSRQRTPYESLHAAWRYDQQVEELIKAYKYSLSLPLAKYCGHRLSSLANQVAETYYTSHPTSIPLRMTAHDLWDLIIPLPSASKQERHRGFSHTLELARIVSHDLDIALGKNILRCTNKRAAQAQLSIAERAHNVKHSFVVTNRLPSRARVLLIDDIVTTGASITSASLALRIGGAEAVDVITLAMSRYFTGRVGMYSAKEQH